MDLSSMTVVVVLMVEFSHGQGFAKPYTRKRGGGGGGCG